MISGQGGSVSDAGTTVTRESTKRCEGQQYSARSQISGGLQSQLLLHSYIYRGSLQTPYEIFEKLDLSEMLLLFC